MTEQPFLINLAEIPSRPVAFLELTVLINLYKVLFGTMENQNNFRFDSLPGHLQQVINLCNRPSPSGDCSAICLLMVDILEILFYP